MQELIDFLAKKEVLIIFIILMIAIFLYIILWVISFIKKKNEKKKLKNNTQELTKLAEQVKLLEKEQREVLPPVFRIKEEIVDFPKIIKREKKQVKEKVVPIKKEEIKKEEPVKKEEAKVVVKETFVSPVATLPVVTEVIEPKKEEQAITKTIKFNDSLEEVEILDVTPSPDLITYKDEVYTQEEAREELKRLERELILQDKKEQEENVITPINDIVELKEVKEVTNEEVIPVLDEMLENTKENITLTNFEQDQEENAIISLEELLERGRVITQEEIVKHEDDGNEPITLQELEERWKNDKEIVSMKEQENTKEEEIELLEVTPEVEQASIKEEPIFEIPEERVKVPTMDELFAKSKKPYTPSPVISPIFGIEEENLSRNNSLSLENTANYDKLDAEIRKTNEFLSKLRELQKKLDN